MERLEPNAGNQHLAAIHAIAAEFANSLEFAISVKRLSYLWRLQDGVMLLQNTSDSHLIIKSCCATISAVHLESGHVVFQSYHPITAFGLRSLVFREL